MPRHSWRPIPSHELAADVSYITAESQLQLGQFAEAEKLLAQLVEKYPGHADAEAWRVRRGLALQLQKKPDEADQSRCRRR